MWKLIIGLVMTMLGLVLTTMGGFLTKDAWEARKAADLTLNNNKREFESQRARAFLIGYEAAFGLAKAIQAAQGVEQQRALINGYLVEIGLPNLKFPSDPRGTNRDAVPAALFAQQVLGSLNALDLRLGAAFTLGWYGVIGTNTPSVVNPEFKVRSYVQKAEFPAFEQAVSDKEIVQRLADQARFVLASNVGNGRLIGTSGDDPRRALRDS
jgi:hypothetical protein